MSPRKSSTSSARAAPLRPRYLGIEVAGEHFPPPSPRWWESTLRRCLERSPAAGRLRLIRSDGYRAIAEVDHLRARSARAAWTTPVETGVRIVSRGTWGTLVGAKRWLRREAAPPERCS